MNGCPQIGGNLWITVGKTRNLLPFASITPSSPVNSGSSPRVLHNLECQPPTFTTCGFTVYPQENRLVTTNTYIFKRKLGNNEPVQDLFKVAEVRML